MSNGKLPDNAALKLDLMFQGIRYSTALGEAADGAFPNFYPYRFGPDETDPTGKGKADIPYMLVTEDGVLSRIKGNGQSPWVIAGDKISGYRLSHDHGRFPSKSVEFTPIPAWMKKLTSEGIAMDQTGISLHTDMAVINVAPACQYFLADKENGKAMRCAFCAYGAPDARSDQLGQQIDQTSLPDLTYMRMKETLQELVSSGEVKHIYLVGGSMTDWAEEGQRFVELARQVQSVNQHRIPVTCGSGALPDQYIKQLRDENLVDAVCFNLEVWSEGLFSKVCPGKHKFVGYKNWIAALEYAVKVFGKGRVYTAMVAGIELGPDYGLTYQEALNLALRGAEDLISRGIIPIYSLFWPVAGHNLPSAYANLRDYFEQLNLGYAQIRRDYGMNIWDGFMCHRCAYMQLECDIDLTHDRGALN
ncbi:MAG: radical SAM protein [Gammaproteobacteria bacterium]